MELYCKKCQTHLGPITAEEISSADKSRLVCPTCNGSATLLRKREALTPVGKESKEERLRRQERSVEGHTGSGVSTGGTTSPPKPKKPKRSPALKILLLVVLGLAVLIWWVMPRCLVCEVNYLLAMLKSGSSRARLKSSDSLKTIYEVKRAPEDLPVSRGARGTITIDRIVELRAMVKAREFDKLNAALDGYQEDFEVNQTDEYKLFDAFDSFDITDSSYEKYFKEWVTHSPDDYQPYLAIAVYYLARGSQSRGTAWARDTSEEQFEGMNHYYSLVEENLAIALTIKENLMPAHLLFISISNASSFGGDEDERIKTALELFPRSYLIGTRSTGAKEPRWGGSYRKMENVAHNAEKYSEANPRLTALYGDIYYDQADRLYREKRNKEALDLITKAISFGDNSGFYRLRSKLYFYRIGNGELALEDINYAIELRPVIGSHYMMRSRIYHRWEHYEDSIEDLRRAELLSPGDSDMIKWKRWASKNRVRAGYEQYMAKDYSGALENYNLGIKYNEENYEGYYWRAKNHLSLSDEASALSDLQVSVEGGYNGFECYRLLDSLLAKEGRWEEIIAYWDIYIESAPEYAAAYYERSGSHYKNRDLESAMRDLKRACELGSAAACERQKKMN